MDTVSSGPLADWPTFAPSATTQAGTGGRTSSETAGLMLIMEVARPGGQRFAKVLAAQIVASSISFGIYFAIAGAEFLDYYKVPHYKFADWQLLAGIPLGLFAAVVVTLLAGFILGAARLFDRLKVPDIAKSVLGGVIFGSSAWPCRSPCSTAATSSRPCSATRGPSAWACSPPRSSRRCSPSASARAAASWVGPSSRPCSSAERTPTGCGPDIRTTVV